MGIQFGDPSVPKYVSSATFHLGLIAGLIVVVSTVFVLDKLGNYMYGRGYAKPFFVFGKRLHHVWIYAMVPLGYLAVTYFVVDGSVQLIKSEMWYRLGLVMPVLAVCLAIDFIGDSRKVSSTGLFRHEWVYALIPVYIFSYVVTVFI